MLDFLTLGADIRWIKAIYTLEMSRRENDKRIITLHVEMKEMMAVLVQYAIVLLSVSL